MTNKEYIEIDKQYYLPTFKRFPVAFVKGKGARVWDADGKEYIDALAGIAVNSLGHCHPAIVDTIREQSDTLMHVSNFFVTPPQANLSKALCEASGLDRIFFTNSGAESVEGAIKVARKYARSKNKGGKVIAMQNSFHGRTLATIAMGKPAMQKGFGPMPEGFQVVPFNDMERIKEVVDEDTAAIILEPVQGEGGIHTAEKEYLQQLRQLCDERDILLIFDEIQCGMGRTGKLFAKEHFGVQPDIMTLAKAMGSGFPVGAFLCNNKVANALDYGDHGTTFGGNPLACAVGLKTLDIINREEFLAEVSRKGEVLREALEMENHPDIEEIRGKGLMLGVVFKYETKPIAAKMLEEGVLVNATAGNVLRLVPPLTITVDELKKVVDTLFHVLKQQPKHA